MVSAAFAGKLNQGVYLNLAWGRVWPSIGLLLGRRYYRLAPNISEDDVRQYLQNKALYPASLPVTAEELAIEQALARRMILLAIKNRSFQAKVMRYGAGLLPWFEPIVASGSVLTHAPNLSQSALMLLDAPLPSPRCDHAGPD